MDLTSYLLGKKSSGGGSSSGNVVCVNVNEQGVLDIKPSDLYNAVTDELYEKMFILRIGSMGEINIYPLTFMKFQNDDLIIKFTETQLMFKASVDNDDYFEYYSVT